MANTKFIYTNGEIKSDLEFLQYRDSSWNWITGAPETVDDDLYGKVAAVFRAVNLTADAVASMPFALVDAASGEDYDVSEKWENKVGFMPNPSELLRLWRMSLFMTNAAYGFMEGNRVVKNLRYIVPSTITPIVNSEDGLTGFKRTVGTSSQDYTLKDRRIFWMWRRDYSTELLPSKYTEFKACMAAAGIMYLSDYYIQNFFQRGGIKPSMLMVKGVPNAQEREKIESIWDKVIHGWSKYLGKIFNADAIEVKTIGEGIENLKDSSLREDQLESIALAAGMPLSLLVSNSANYATAETEYTAWFRNSIVPWSGFMADVMNDVLFTPMGLRFEFRYEMSEEGQEEEVKRSIAYARYVQSGMKPSVAAQIVGIDLPGDMEYEDLDPDEEAQPTTDSAPRPNADLMKPEPGEEMPEEAEEKRFVPSMKQMGEIKLWHDIARRKMKRGDSMEFEFTSSLPDDIHAGIAGKIAASTNGEQLDEAFDLSGVEQPEYKTGDSELFALVTALNKAVEVIT